MSEQAQASGWWGKFLGFPLTRLVLAIVWMLIVLIVAEIVGELLPGKGTIPVQLLSMVITVALVWLGYAAFVRWLEKRPVSELAIAGAPAELGAGILVGVLLFCATVGLLALFGFYKITGVSDWTVMIPAFVASVVAGFQEEVLFRGVLFRIVEGSLGSWLALLISALVFGLLHLANPNATLSAGIAIALEAGVMLAAAYMLTRRLWLAIGIHFAWNFTQGGIFGVAVSGHNTSGLLQGTLSGPALFSGGDFGAEASIFAVVVCLTAGIVLLWQAHKRGQFIQPFWSKRSEK